MEVFCCYDEELWSIVFEWFEQCASGTFTELLPIFRRTFANFTAPERKKMGEKVKFSQHKTGSTLLKTASNTNHEQAEKSIPLVLKLLGKIS